MSQASEDKIPFGRIDFIIQESIEKIIEAITFLNMSITIDDDMGGLQKYLLESGAYPNPSFDPDVSHLGSDAFWLRIEDRNGRIIASHAERIFSCDDFIRDIVATDELWFARGANQNLESWRTEITAPPARISGKVGYAGGMFIQPEHRGSGLALFLPYLSRSLCLRNHQTQWHTGLVHLNIASSPIPTHRYGYPRTARIFHGRCPRTVGDFKEVHLCWMDRKESIEKIFELPYHDRYPIKISAVLNNIGGFNTNTDRNLRPNPSQRAQNQ
jgi:hypothetical protein